MWRPWHCYPATVMDFEIRPVSLDQIETTDHTFKITTTTDNTELALSISAIGLLQPPILIENGRSYTIVCGFRRIDACIALNLSSIAVRILGPDCSPIECAHIAIADNTFQRSLNVVEQSRAYTLIHRFEEDSSARLKMAQSIGLPESQAAMDRIRPVCAMPKDLQENILSGRVALPVALQINRLATDDSRALSGLFSLISASLNVQRELLDLTVDISRRDGTSIAGLINKDKIAGILKNEESSAPQKVQQLRKILKTERYPALSKAEDDYHQMVNSIQLNSRIHIQPPRFFEGKTYRVTMSVETRQQLKGLQTELDKLANHPHLLPE